MYKQSILAGIGLLICEITELCFSSKRREAHGDNLWLPESLPVACHHELYTYVIRGWESVQLASWNIKSRLRDHSLDLKNFEP